ncbi:DUF1002 domain-containing protein (plasmid) [Limosilactobacillus reuteri]|uniref:DUF1002 domain-containing protein n=1 Tax=Limosilactobacillus reuteri TaxID=1598 RepID=A0A517D8H3_LIMRT|nr:DUF1002 domain-containing protein [Limosilactobacillus reuteri]QDR73636.1 DUF1002 domain-containing protein [Limosilactobacillus reuteri]
MQSQKIKKILISSSLILTLLTTTVTQTTISADSSEQIQNTNQTSNAHSSQQGSSSSGNQNQTHTLSNSYVVYGAGASNQQELNSVLSVNNNFKKLTATAADYKKFIDPKGSTTDAAMISSVSIVPTDPNSGIKVNVNKFNGRNNITKVTAQQYAMVAQMAGVTDVTITVSANTPVSGESALTGVYVAIQNDGATLNNQNTQTANQMLGATSKAIDANKDNDNYPGKLMAAIGDTTKAINQDQKNGKIPSQNDIQIMLNHRLFLHGIYSETKNYEQPIINALVKFNNSPISSSKDYSSHVDDTIKNVKNSSGQIMNNAKQLLNSKNRQEAQNWFDKLVQWFKEIF